MLLIINALKNPGLYLFKQGLQYKRLFWLTISQKLITAIIVILIAYQYRTFWALIIGDLIASGIYTIGSFLIHKHRPKLTLINKTAQWSFSKWLLLKSIVGYTRSQIDTIVVSKLFPSALIGQYYMLRNIAMLPCHNIFMPAIEPLLASFRVDKKSPEKLAQQINFSFIIVSLFTLPLVIFVWGFPELIVSGLLGDKWTSHYLLLRNFSLLLLYFPYVLIFEQIFIIKNWVKAAFSFDVMSLALLIAGFIMFNDWDLESIALYRGVMGVATTLILAFLMRTKVTYSLIKVLVSAALSVIIAFTAFYVTSHLMLHLPFIGNIPLLLAAGCIFFTLYFVTLYIFIYLFASMNKDAYIMIQYLHTLRKTPVKT